uniref:retention module-containing protein n=1 Tax=Thiomicrorhabdus chilensis TaxID=63656 RepID=UPI000491F302
MSIVAGKITAVTGTVQAVNPNTGEVRLLVVGDQVFADEVIITSVTGGVTVDLNNGDLLTLGRNTEMVLDDDVVGLAADSATEGAVDVEALQQALLDGIIDPEDLEATAAGEGDASSANSGGLNVVERLGSEGEVTSGFDTGTRSANDITTREFVGDIVVPVIVSLSGDTSVQEGAAAGYIVSLNDENGNPVVVSQDLTVDFTYSYITAEGEDIVETLSVTVPAGSSSFAFEVNTVDDALAEAPEDFSIAINSITAGAEQFVDISVDDTPVITTITDDTTPNNPPGEEDTVYAVLTGAESVVEGEQATYTVSLVDKDNNPVTLTEGQSYTVDLSTNSEGLTLAATEGTDYVSLDGDTLTLTGTAAGVSSADFTVSTTD